MNTDGRGFMKMREDLKIEARRAWAEYGDATVEAFRFPKGSKIKFDGFEAVLKDADEKRLKELIGDVRARTTAIRDAKFVGEP